MPFGSMVIMAVIKLLFALTVLVLFKAVQRTICDGHIKTIELDSLLKSVARS